MSDLIDNIDKIHTTTLGTERIRRNLGLKSDDVVTWCKEKIGQAHEINRIGKNWYVRTDNVIITVNTHSFTIITAHEERTK